MKSICFSLLFVIGTLNLMSQEINKTIFIQENSMITYTRSYATNVLSIPEWQIYSNTKLGYVFLKHHAGYVFNSVNYSKLNLDNATSHLTQNQLGIGYRFIYLISKFSIYCDAFYSKFYFYNNFIPLDSSLLISGTNSNGNKYGGELGFSYFVASKTTFDISVNYFIEKLNIENRTIERKKGLQFSFGLQYYFSLKK